VSTPDESSRGRRPRGPGATYTALAVAMLLGLAAFAYSVPQQPPPTIAAFAPQPKKLIIQPPPEQTTIGENKSSKGRGNGGTGTKPSAKPTTPPKLDTKAAVEVPRQRDCVGQLQIDDPQSPPCVPGFIGDNGGATSFGVTKDQITVAVSANEINFIGAPVVADLFKFFNKRFELYGRSLAPVTLDDSADQEQTTTVDQMISDAITVHDELKAFATAGYGFEQEGTTHYYYDKLAQLGVMSSQYTTREPVTLVNQAHLAQYAPYQWNFAQTLDQIQTADVDLICSALARRPARFAGTPDLSTQQRKFGLILQYKSNTDPPKNQILKAGVKRCTGQDLVQVSYTDGDVSQIPNLLSSLRSEGVTTVMCMCYWAQLDLITMPAASNAGYHPEWFLDGFGGNDEDWGCHQNCPPDQAKGVFALRAGNKARTLAETPYMRAVKDVDPTYQANGCGGCSYNAAPGSSFSNDAQALYQSLLTLASGIQMAGPRLTPKTFQQGLFKTRFPNPGCDGPPAYQGCVGFSGASHSMLDSFALEYWSTSAIAPQYQTPGTFCYVGLGRRFRIGNMPKTDAVLFERGAPCH
jgi:hypothetical protein